MKTKRWALIIVMLSLVLLSACSKKLSEQGDASSKITNNKEAIDKEEEAIDKENEFTENSESPKKFVNKLDPTKPYVYDIKIYKDAGVKSYYNEYGGETYYIEDIKFPFINIDSPAVKKANEEILAIGKECLEYFKKRADGIIQVSSIGADFIYNERDGILSVFCNYHYVSMDVPMDDYLTINIDLETGKEISFNEILKIRKLENSYEDKIESYIYRRTEQLTEAKSIILGLNLNLFWKELENNSQKWFIDDKGHLILASNFYIPAGAGIMNELIDIDEINEEKEFINTAWEAFEIPEDKLAAMIFLGYGHNDETRAAISENIKKVQKELNLAKDYTPPLLNIFKTYEIDGYKERLIDGNEYYLFIPKHRNAIISMIPIEWPEEKKDLDVVEDDWYSKYFYAGNSIFLCNVSDLRPDTKFTYKYRDTEFEFSPYISLADGEETYPNEVFNLAKYIDFNKIDNIGEDEGFNKMIENLRFVDKIID